MASFSAESAKAAYAKTPRRPSVSDDEFDLAKRERTSLFPWRGQFSPDLIRLFLELHPGNGAVLDPFMGSGTVLFEANRAGRASAGTEINPGAYLFAVLAEFVQLPLDERQLSIQSLQRRLSSIGTQGEFSPSQIEGLASSKNDVRLLEASFLLACGNKPSTSNQLFVKAFQSVASKVAGAEFTRSNVDAFAEDARYLPFDDHSFELAITSPPYINVFNYHQQFRPPVEELGYRPLQVATSEIGANRKHRQNRLLTVVQYCLDMSMALDELARVTSPGGHAILVVGRESRVRKVGFDNGALMGSLLHARTDLRLSSRAERKFTNRFGEVIFEDVLFAERSNSVAARADLSEARSVGVHALDNARFGRDLEVDVMEDFETAIAGAGKVLPSPRVSVEGAGLVSVNPTRRRA